MDAETTQQQKLFQFTPLCEGRLSSRRSLWTRMFYFNSRPCVRGDQPAAGRVCKYADFNSRPCVRGDEDDNLDVNAEGKFQFTPLCEGRREEYG